VEQVVDACTLQDCTAKAQVQYFVQESLVSWLRCAALCCVAGECM